MTVPTMAEAVYLDACLLIYLVEEDPVFGDRVANALRARDPRQLAVSPLVRMEVLVKPIRIADLPLQRRYEQALDALTLLDMPAEVYDAAAVLRARFGLRTPDALHLACAQHHGCQALWTNDGRLARASLGLARNILAEPD